MKSVIICIGSFSDGGKSVNEIHLVSIFINGGKLVIIFKRSFPVIFFFLGGVGKLIIKNN